MLQIHEGTRKVSTCNRLDLETLGYRLIRFRSHFGRHIHNDIKGPTRGYHNWNTSQRFVFGEQIEVRESLYTRLMIRVNTILDHLDTLRAIVPRYEGSWMVSKTILFSIYTRTTPLVSKNAILVVDTQNGLIKRWYQSNTKFEPPLLQYISECMVLIININSSIKEPTHDSHLGAFSTITLAITLLDAMVNHGRGERGGGCKYNLRKKLMSYGANQFHESSKPSGLLILTFTTSHFCNI